MRPNLQYLQSVHVVILFVIHLDLLPSSIHTQSLHSIADSGCCYCPSGKEWETDRQRVERESTRQPPTAIQIYYLYTHSGHFTAVFTLDPAVSIRWQGPWLQMFLTIHRSTASLSADPPPHFLIHPLTLLIKKKNPNRHFPWDFNSQHYSKSKFHSGGV